MLQNFQLFGLLFIFAAIQFIAAYPFDDSPKDPAVKYLTPREPAAVNVTSFAKAAAAPPYVLSLTIAGQMKITDQEPWPFPAERGTHYWGPLTVHLSESVPVINFEPIKKCTGGEVRGELYLSAILNPTTKQVRLTGMAKYFEGTSCSTNDLQQERSIEWTGINAVSGEKQFVAPVMSDKSGSVAITANAVLIDTSCVR